MLALSCDCVLYWPLASTSATWCAYGSSPTSWLAFSWFWNAPGRKLENDVMCSFSNWPAIDIVLSPYFALANTGRGISRNHISTSRSSPAPLTAPAPSYATPWPGALSIARADTGAPPVIYISIYNRKVLSVCLFVTFLFIPSRLVFHGTRSVSWFFMVPGWFFMVPGRFFMVFHGSRSVFHGYRSVFLVFHGSRLVFMVFHGSRLVFLYVYCILARQSSLGLAGRRPALA